MMKKTTRTYLVLALLVITSQIIGCSAGGGKVSTLKASYTISVNVSGLSVAGLAANKGLILQNNGGDTLTITGNGRFTFGGPLPNGRDYKVLVNTNPEGMTCSVANGRGTVSGADVTNVDVSCANIETTYTIGGTLSGLMSGKSLVLQNNGGNDITRTNEGGFTFAAQSKDGAAYSVTVATPPANQSCTVINGTGTVNKAAVTNILVVCVINSGPTELRLDFGIKQLKFHWSERVGATNYKLFKKISAQAVAQEIANINVTDPNPLSYTLGIEAIHFYDWPNMSYLMKVCDADGCSSDFSNEVTLVDASAKAVGYFKASNTGANDYFGWSVALSADGQTLAVGAFNESSDGTAIEAPNAAGSKQANNQAPKSGAVYVYTRDASSGDWSQQAYIKASNANADDLFGISVALSEDGNTLAVGAVNEDGSATGSSASTVGVDNDAAVNAGAAYVFRRSGTTWTQEAYVKASNTGAGDGFGYKLALSGDGNTLAVGAIYEDSNSAGTPADNSVQDAGAVYVFTRLGTTWSQEQYLKAANPGAGDFFGYSVALNNNDGNTLAVGAIHEDGDVVSTMGVPNDNAANAGAAYVFTRAAGTWTQQQYVKATNIEAGDDFGYSVALSGDGNKLAVGAPYEDGSSTGIDGTVNNSAQDSGAVYVFTSGTPWTQQAYVKASNTDAYDGFGYAVALNPEGDTLAVGAYHESGSAVGINGTQSTNAAAIAGAVYVYSYATAWTQKAYVKGSNTIAGDNFGSAVSLSKYNSTTKEKTLAVGAYAETSGSTGVGSTRSPSSSVFAGAVYLY